MKSILVICDQAHIDVPLRRSLAHLVKTCEVEVVPDGYHALNELAAKTFDVIIINSEIKGIDSLELVESFEYIDPGVPVIVMLKQEHKPMWEPARRLNAQPILRPFKALTFLRLIDTLLHEHLEHYRELAKTLRNILEGLNTKTEATLSFLVDNSGQPLIFAGEVNVDLVKSLGNLAVRKTVANDSFDPLVEQELNVLAPNSAEQDHDLYLTIVLENLYLAVASPTSHSYLAPDDIWQWVDTTAMEIKTVFYKNAYDGSGPVETDKGNLNGKTHQHHNLIPLKLDLPPSSANIASKQEDEDEESTSVNRQITSDSSNVLNRLQDFYQVN